MRKKLALIIPFFGKLPKYMQLFWNSCIYNEEVDFLLFTDDTSVQNHIIPSNVYVYITSFEEIKSLFRRKLNDKYLYLDIPYKLCDYKPTYGCVFQDYIQEYEYWGHCDIDLIFGDIMKFLSQVNYTAYDRIFPYGHLSIYRNTHEINSIFIKKLPRDYAPTTKFEYVKQTTYPCNFDEFGANLIFKHFNYKFYDNFHHLQIQDQQEVFRSKYRSRTPEIITFEEGHIYSYESIGDKIVRNEYIYVHLQDRKIMPILIDDTTTTKTFLITHKGFIKFNEQDITTYFQTYGRNDSKYETKRYIKNRKQSERRGRITKFVREIKVYKVKGVYNVLCRVYSVLISRVRTSIRKYVH